MRAGIYLRISQDRTGEEAGINSKCARPAW
jgi:hypothetical protein